MRHPKTGEAAVRVGVRTRGDVADDVVRHARKAVSALAGHGRAHLLSADVRLTQHAGPGSRRPAMAQVNLDVNGRPVRVQVAAASMWEAVDLAADRCRELLTVVGGRSPATRGGPLRTLPAGWLPGAERPHRPDFARRRAAERGIVRRKVYPVPAQDLAEAAFDLETRDQDFHLFTDSASGQDSIVYRALPHGYLLAQVGPQPRAEHEDGVPVTVNAIPAPRMTLAEARTELDAVESPFLFFADRDTGRGNVLYRRHDGHYGLISPADETAQEAKP